MNYEFFRYYDHYISTPAAGVDRNQSDCPCWKDQPPRFFVIYYSSQCWWLFMGVKVRLEVDWNVVKLMRVKIAKKKKIKPKVLMEPNSFSRFNSAELNWIHWKSRWWWWACETIELINECQSPGDDVSSERIIWLHWNHRLELKRSHAGWTPISAFQLIVSFIG